MRSGIQATAGSTGISAYELAAKMQLAAPEALDLTRETVAVRNLYGTDDPTTATFGRQCLTARRPGRARCAFRASLELPAGFGQLGRNHTHIKAELPNMARAADRPIAALLRLEAAWTARRHALEHGFGRHPFSQGADGRDHNGGTMVQWLAGAGVKGGVAHGESDEWSWRGNKANEVHDVHATILHLLGIDHERLTFRNNGSDRRLTDVHGHVIRTILA